MDQVLNVIDIHPTSQRADFAARHSPRGSATRCRYAAIAVHLIASISLAFAAPARGSGYGPFDPVLRGSKFGAVASFMTNYFYRGYTKSDNLPTVRGNVDVEHDSGFYGGAWLSRIDFSNGHLPGHSDLEFYPYVGYSHEITDAMRAEILVSRYIFNDQVFGRYSDYNDYSIAVHYRDLASARVYFADNAYHRGKPFTTYEVSGRHPILDTLEFSAGAGYNDAEAVLEYDAAYWHAGLTWYWHWMSVDVRYVDSHFFEGHETTEEALEPDQIVLFRPDPKFVFSLNIGY